MNTHLKLGLLLPVVVAAISTPSHAEPPLPGAVFTSSAGCLAVNNNIYDFKADVYLNGGPSRPGAAGLLPNTSYYIQVTDPSGQVVLGSSLNNRSNNLKPVLANNLGNFSDCYQLANIVSRPPLPGQVGGDPGYNDTPNSGNEYKVWISTASNFLNSSTKTDNFKVRERESNPPPTSDKFGKVTIRKFYDFNLNGKWDPDEPTVPEAEIPGWKVDVYGYDPKNTPAEYGNLPWDVYTGREYFPNEVGLSTTITYSPWFATNAYVADSFALNGIQGASVAKGIMNTLPVELKDSASDRTVYFGNVCTGKGGGLTLGYWSNQNGQRDMTNAGMSALLNGLSFLNLRSATGANFDPGNYTQFRNWLLQGSATNMAYMLSVQMAAMWLNVQTGKVKGDPYVYAEGVYVTGQSTDSGFIKVSALIAEANQSLGSDGYTRAGVPARTYQEYLKNALDLANNDKSFVQPKACSFSFANPVVTSQ